MCSANILSATPKFWLLNMALRTSSRGYKAHRSTRNVMILSEIMPTCMRQKICLYPLLGRLGDLKIRCGAKNFSCGANSRREKCGAKSR